jgi:hypothetical protein
MLQRVESGERRHGKGSGKGGNGLVSSRAGMIRAVTYNAITSDTTSSWLVGIESAQS